MMEHRPWAARDRADGACTCAARNHHRHKNGQANREGSGAPALRDWPLKIDPNVRILRSLKTT
jgi:hypothetical protein